MTPALFLVGTAVAASAVADRPVEFNAQIRPILSDRCFVCHGPDGKNRQRGLRLDTPEGMRKEIGGDRAIAPGDPEHSVVLQRLLAADDDERMPPADSGKKRLTPEEVALIKRWIAEGAKWQKHWSFEAVRRRDPPAVRQSSWPRNDIDRFVLARLEAEGLSPSPEADRATLIRRVSLDLLGLPPALKEIRAFVADRRGDAYERLVDRLLASPHHGERWGRHWLDLARYADSNGYSIDSPRVVWKYRDWVVAALNRDLPFDQFVIEQIAGDLLPNATIDQKVATGFHRNTMFNEEGGIDREQFRVEAVADRVATTGSVLLGLTLGCARCHDHKFDPLAQKEFFGLFAFFNDADEPTLDLGTPAEVALAAGIKKRLAQAQLNLDRSEKKWLSGLGQAERDAVPKEISVIMALMDSQRDANQWQTLLDYLAKQAPGFQGLSKTIKDLRGRLPQYPTALVMASRPKPRDTRVHIGGDFTRPGDAVEPGVPEVLHPLRVCTQRAGARASEGGLCPPERGGVRGRASGSEPPPCSVTRASRLDLACWLVDAANPLVGRVTVNRLWQQYFGVGLVETENDFGTQGAPPSHPELLDWLASELHARGFSLKAMHRLIVTSATYRQGSTHRPELAERDALNRLLGRQNRLRLEAEVIRDAALAASGLLDRRLGGPPVFPPQPDGVVGFTQIPRVWRASSGSDRFRRGLYTHIFRSAPHPALTVFDAPDGQFTCTRRNRSTTPLQALTLLNDQAFVEIAQGLGGRVLRQRGSDRQRITSAFRLAVGRPPEPDEVERMQRFLDGQRVSFAADGGSARALAAGPRPVRGVAPVEMSAWTALARVILNLDELVTRQ